MWLGFCSLVAGSSVHVCRRSTVMACPWKPNFL